MEEVVEIVGAQISCAALGVIQVLERIRLVFERIEAVALCVLQGHVNPVEQLCRLVHGGTGLYSGHHVVAGGLHRQKNRRIVWTPQLLTVIPLTLCRMAVILAFNWRSHSGPQLRNAQKALGAKA